jgi:hypothetical protein
MKNLKTLLLIFCIALLSASFASQEESKDKEFTYSAVMSQFCRGFNDGYKEGYCYDRYGCISPIPPICPMLEIGERQDSYKDGYNRGFKTALKNRN